MAKSERAGVYTSYEVSGVRYSGHKLGVVGVTAMANGGEADAVYTITNEQTAAAVFGADSNIVGLIKILLQNGAAVIKAIPLFAAESETLPEEEAYKKAFSLLAAEEDVKILVCDSKNAEVHIFMKEVITGQDGRFVHKLGVVESDAVKPEDLAARAAAINCERMVLVASNTDKSAEDGTVPGCMAAAFAGVIVSGEDPALPLNGAELRGVTGGVYTDEEIGVLVRGGVTPVEYVGGVTTVVRGITTRTLTDGTDDATWRELTTLLVVDDVIPTVRDALKTGFARVKNTAQTRGAIRTRVMIELEKKKKAEIIEAYENVRVQQNEEDPTVCDVSFGFTVAHGLNQIRILAYITV